jgi:putative oxidoreductase
MKKCIVLLGLLCLISTSCVQKTNKQTVVFNLDVKGIKGIKNVGIRGIDKPLSWDYDSEMKIGKDSIYTASIAYETGYKYTEVKFIINGDFELKGQPNRRIVFDKSGLTINNSEFNKLE